MGLRDRWCPGAELVEGSFRGSTGMAIRREYARISDELRMKGADVMVFLTDCDTDEWRAVQRNERDKFPADRLELAVHGVCDRNIECWICIEAEYVAERLGVVVAALRVADPKGAFEGAMRITRDDRREPEIAELVRQAPLHRWLESVSFEDFYEQLRNKSARLGCQIENLRDRRR